ncbi:MAG: hypothetical protein JNM74_08880 [Myxococcales bacterium]|nr:hypothetical protein [Myxococcales bacterium]
MTTLTLGLSSTFSRPSRAVTLAGLSLALVCVAEPRASAAEHGPRVAHADEPHEAPLATRFDDEVEPKVPENLPDLVLTTGKVRRRTPEPKVVFFDMHGEYQLRYQAQRSVLMVPTASAVDERPGLLEDSTGQNHFVSHWLRLDPRLVVTDKLKLVSQFDLLTGVVMGQLTRGVSADDTPRDEYDGFKNVQLRWLYAEAKLPIGIVRVGQQPNHWGMGILANDGNHPTLFGDYRYGSISERILFATKPGGESSDFVIALAGDLVFRDQNAKLSRGDQAFQGVLAAYWERGQNQVGVFSTLRRQRTDRASAPFSTYTDAIDAAAVDLFAKFAAPVPGTDATVFGAAEGAVILGTTNAIRTQDQARDDEKTTLRSYGGAAIVGIAHRARVPEGAAAKAPGEKGFFGDLVAQVEVGYASGDADPYDGTQKRFVFDGNHRIGLVLFDEVLRFQTARASTAARDPLLSNGERPTPGSDRIPTNGGVFGATYVNPTFVYRPHPSFDVKAGMLLAQSTADVVDPYRTATSGSYVNARGGNPRAKDYGLELDAGVEWRKGLSFDMTLALGMQAGILFPGDALADAMGARLKTPWVTVTRAGLYF